MFETLYIFGVHLYASDKLTFTIDAQDGGLHLRKYPSRTGDDKFKVNRAGRAERRERERVQ